MREAIERHRRGLDETRSRTAWRTSAARGRGARRRRRLHRRQARGDRADRQHDDRPRAAVRRAAAAAAQEILTTTHDHYGLRGAAPPRRVHTGARVRKVPLYAVPEKATVDEIVGNLVKGIGPRTRAVACTWVHSSTGVKLPIRRMADAIADVNKKRAEARSRPPVRRRRARLRRRAGIVRRPRLRLLRRRLPQVDLRPARHRHRLGQARRLEGSPGIIPTFEWAAFKLWMQGKTPESLPPGPRVTPGGFHPFEHRWALAEAFRFHLAIGKPRVTARIHELAQRCKQGLAAIGGKVKLRTPMADELSAGINCFEIDGIEPEEIVEAAVREEDHCERQPLRDVVCATDAGRAEHAGRSRPRGGRGEGDRGLNRTSAQSAQRLHRLIDRSIDDGVRAGGARPNPGDGGRRAFAPLHECLTAVPSPPPSDAPSSASASAFLRKRRASSGWPPTRVGAGAAMGCGAGRATWSRRRCSG